MENLGMYVLVAIFTAIVVVLVTFGAIKAREQRKAEEMAKGKTKDRQ